MTTPKIVRPFVFAIVAVLALLLISCQSQQPPAAPAAAPTAAPAAPTTAPAPATAAPAQAQPTAAGQPAAQPAPATLKIGLMPSLTGPTARIGLNIERFIKMGIEDINSKGGVKAAGKAYRLETVSADSKFTSEGGREAANRLVLAEKVSYILGSLMPDSAGAQPITEASKVLIVSFSTLDASLGPKFPFTIQAGGPVLPMRVPVLYQWLKKDRPDAKRVAYLQTDDSTGKAYVNLAEGIAKDNGFTVVAKEFFPTDIKDLTPLVTRVLRENPDAIDIGATGGMAPLLAGLAKALDQQNYRKSILATAADVSTMRSNSAILGGFVSTTMLDRTSDAVGAQEKELMRRYIAQFPEADLEPITVPAYNIPIVLAQGMEKAGTVEDTEKVANALRAGQWDTVFGKSAIVGAKTFGAPVALEQTIYLSKVDGGKIVTFQGMKGTMP